LPRYDRKGDGTRKARSDAREVFVSFVPLDVDRKEEKSVVSVSSVVGSKTHIFFSNTDWSDLSDVLIILIRHARGGDCHGRASLAVTVERK